MLFIMHRMETAFATVLRVWVALWGAFALFVAFYSKGEVRWGRGGKGPLMRPQWLGRLFIGIIGLFLILLAILLKVAPKR